MNRPVAAIAIGLLLLAGCHAAPESAGGAPASGPAARAVPADFSIDLVVRGGSRSGPIAPAHLRGAHYVLFADGSFHHGVAATPSRLPPRTRHLSREQVARLYAELADAGLADVDAGDPPVNATLTPPPPDDALQFLLTCTGWEQRWMFDRTMPVAAAGDEPIATIARHLAALAWAPDTPRPTPAIIPRRYDLGPDPYEVYRR
ncbi:MAG: hypothetical protein HKO59_02550 [Phycisphaerales bacterium]|nr:hypothetical protein [Phycisphaerales bacterium]NNM24861.1 hypothetical protein [Phycisphaerales bacterium]